MNGSKQICSTYSNICEYCYVVHTLTIDSGQFRKTEKRMKGSKTKREIMKINNEMKVF